MGLDKPAAIRIASSITRVYAPFEQTKFVNRIAAGIEPLELKQRLDYFINVLADYLPPDFERACQVLINVKKYWDYGDPNDNLRSFAAWPLTDYVATYGLAHPQLSLNVMYHLTELFSAEFAIRPFIKRYPDLVHQHLTQWQFDDNHHVRRLVSEGTRPRLPWGMRLQAFCKNPNENLIYLENLRSDSTDYVRRSVANHLNDIAKDNPNIVIDICKKWQKNASTETQWVIKHGCRTLIKAGYPPVFPLLGFTERPVLGNIKITLKKSKISLGEYLTFTVELKSKHEQNQKLAIDYAIEFMKANGEQKAKVFKLKEINLAANSPITIVKNHPIKAITTRKYYNGPQNIVLFINGKPVANTSFELTNC